MKCAYLLNQRRINSGYGLRWTIPVMIPAKSVTGTLKNCLFARLRCRCENKKCSHTLCMLRFLILALLVLRQKF